MKVCYLNFNSAIYSLQFSFDSNPFFDNSEIVKEFNWNAAEPHSSTTEIKWKQGKNKVRNIFFVSYFSTLVSCHFFEIIFIYKVQSKCVVLSYAIKLNIDNSKKNWLSVLLDSYLYVHCIYGIFSYPMAIAVKNKVSSNGFVKILIQCRMRSRRLDR